MPEAVWVEFDCLCWLDVSFGELLHCRGGFRFGLVFVQLGWGFVFFLGEYASQIDGRYFGLSASVLFREHPLELILVLINE